MKYPEFKKYTSIPFLDGVLKILNNPVEVYEKLDGGNAQVRMHKGVILSGNRSKFLTDKDTRFEWFKDFLRWSKGNYSFYNLPENLIVFGEWLSHHTLYYPEDAANRFYLLDIFDTNKRKFLEYSCAKKILSDLEVKDIEFLNPVVVGKVTRKDLEKIVKHSSYKEGESEGVVIKHYPSQSFAKLWTSSLKKQSQLTYDNLRRTYISMSESGKDVNEDSLSEELFKDLEKANSTTISYGDVEKYVNAYYNYLNLEFKTTRNIVN